jgi:hypothetical protein
MINLCQVIQGVYWLQEIAEMSYQPTAEGQELVEDILSTCYKISVLNADRKQQRINNGHLRKENNAVTR